MPYNELAGHSADVGNVNRFGVSVFLLEVVSPVIIASCEKR